MWTLQSRTKMFYSNDVLISSYDFLEMMLLDGCFVVELLRHLGCNENVVDLDDSIFPRPWLIRVLIRDLLREDNQLPHFLLQSLFPWSQCDDGEGTYTSPILALKDFGLSFPTASETINKSRNFEGKHLLDLFRLSFLPFDHARCFSPSPASDRRQDGIQGTVPFFFFFFEKWHRAIETGETKKDARSAQPRRILQNGASSDQLEEKKREANSGQASVTIKHETTEASESYWEEETELDETKIELKLQWITH
ncbi:hypothetical protein QUC31_018905 [Theobroma cacao]